MTMTPSQLIAVEIAKTEILENDSHHADGYEYKKWEVEEAGFAVIIRSEVGLIGDEGTMASVLGRSRRQIFVGRRGGYTLSNPAKFVDDGNGKIKSDFSDKLIKGRRALWYPAK